MAIMISQGSGATLASDLVGQLHYSQGKIYDGTIGSTNAWIINSSGAGLVQLNHLTSLASGSMVGLNPSSNYIGLTTTTVANTVPVTGTFWQTTQPVSFNQLVSLASGTLVGLNASANYIGLVTVANTVPVTGTFWQATQPVSFSNVTINTGPNQIGSVTISNNPTIGTGTNYIGLVTVANTVPVTGTFWQATQPVSFSNVTLNAGISQIGSVTISNQPTLGAGANYIGLVTTTPASLPALAVGTNFIGLATTVPGYQPVTSQYTSFTTYFSASGLATLFAPPNNQRFVIKDLIIGSLGRSEVQIFSGATTVLIPYIALATTGGYLYPGGDTGLRGKALNDTFVVGLNTNGATISVMVNVRFDPT